MFKMRNIFLLLGTVVVAGLLLGMTLGRFDNPEMIYRESDDVFPRKAAVRTDSVLDREPDRPSPYAAISSRPDFDYDREVWPEDQARYRYDPDYAMENDEDFAREMRRAYSREYGRDFYWPDGTGDDRQRNSEETQEAPQPVLRNPVSPPGSSRYDSIRESESPSSARDAGQSSGTAQAPAPREPRAAGGELPAIW